MVHHYILNLKLIKYTNERAIQLNKIEKLVVDKPIPIEKPKAIKTNNKPIEKPIIRKSTREKKQWKTMIMYMTRLTYCI